MSTETEHIQLAAADTIVSVRARLAQFRGRRILLVWPADTPLFRRKLDLVLIQREAYRRAIQLALVSQDKTVTAHAAELNISCFASIAASANERWKRGRQKIFLPRYHKPNADLQPEDLALIAARIENRKRHAPWRTALERLIVLALLIGVSGAALYVILPSAVVRLSLYEEEVSAIVDIVADRKAETIDLDKGLIPAQTLRETVETTASIPASGIFWLDSVSSAGLVTFTNLGDERVSIPKGTILATSAGEPILFETAADVVVPAGDGQSVDATVAAREGFRGSIGNVGAGMINTVFGALADSVSVINLAPAAGGGNRSVQVVDAQDRARLLDSVRIQLQSLAFDKMRSALSDSETIVIESLHIEDERKEWTSFSAEVGTMTSELTLTMRAIVSALAIDERYGRQIALTKLKSNLAPSQALSPASIEYDRGPFALGRTAGQVHFTVASSAAVAVELDMDSLRRQLAGLSLDEARDLLAALPKISESSPPVLEVYPHGFETLPILPLRIDLRVKASA
ncbi:MAG: baseplate J/gp47 family protein [Chloroflexi bacterium]|nr:baseplate J/gp47 family protein [Chloroflexota bacterium]